MDRLTVVLALADGAMPEARLAAAEVWFAALVVRAVGLMAVMLLTIGPRPPRIELTIALCPEATALEMI